jgi:hypothetical protein
MLKSHIWYILRTILWRNIISLTGVQFCNCCRRDNDWLWKSSVLHAMLRDTSDAFSEMFLTGRDSSNPNMIASIATLPRPVNRLGIIRTAMHRA